MHSRESKGVSKASGIAQEQPDADTQTRTLTHAHTERERHSHTQTKRRGTRVGAVLASEPAAAAAELLTE